MTYRTILTAGALLAAAPAAAQEAWIGVSAHEVDTPFSLDIGEGGTDVQAGVRGKPIEALRAVGAPAPYLLGVVNTRGDTSLVAAGLSWRIGRTVYLRPGIGLAVHDGPSYRITNRRRTDLGSRVLFEPELAAGVQIGEGVAVEASWVHVSHAQLFSGQNPGLDIIGARLMLKL